MDNKKIMGVFILIFFIMIATVSAADNTTDTTTISTNTADTQTTSTDDTTINDEIKQNITSKVNVGVKYQYENDNGKITPSVSAKINNKNITTSQKYDKNLNIYTIAVNHSDDVKTFNLTLSAPGYKSQTKTFNVTQNEGLVYNLEATQSYQYGDKIASIADSKLNFSKADDILVITSAGVPTYKNEASEYIIEAIMNYCNGTVSNGKGNMLMLRQTENDPIDTCFVVRNGRNMNAIVFLNSSTKYSYLGTISENMTRKEWNSYYKSVGQEDSYSFASLANGWYHNVSYLVLQEAAFHGHICEGTLGGYTITEALLQYYPPITETATPGSLPAEKTSYKVLGMPGDSASDAVLYFLDATSGKRSYVGFNTTKSGAEPNMMGFIRWNEGTIEYNPQTNSYEFTTPSYGTVIVMKYNTDENKKLFTKETGIELTGTLEELKYNSWWINKINTNPASLVSIVLEKDNLTEEQYYYLIGLDADLTNPVTVANATNAGSVRVKAIHAHGLDYNYLKSLDLPNATRSNSIADRANRTYDDFKNIGVRASTLAKNYFKNELGVDLIKDMPNLAVMTTAGHVYMEQQTTEAVWDGLFQELGSRLYRQTLMPDHNAIWKSLWFAFVLHQDNGDLMSLYMRYNPSNDSFLITDYEGSHIININIESLNNSNQTAIAGKIFPDGNYNSIQSITNAWSNGITFGQLCSFLFHNHACPGVQPGFFMSDYILNNYPLNENESYFYIANSIYCKDDSLEYLLGISPGLGSYMSQKIPGEKIDHEDGSTDEGVLVIWDNELNVGRAVIMNFKWATIDTSKYATSDAKRAAQIRAYNSIYHGQPNEDVLENYAVTPMSEKWITADEYAKLKAGTNDNLDSMSFIRGIENRTKQQAISLTSGDKLINTNYNSSEYTNTNTNNNLVNNGGSQKFPNSGSHSNNNNFISTNSAVASRTSSSSNNLGQSSGSSDNDAVAPGMSLEATADLGVAQASEDSAQGEEGNAKAYEVSESQNGSDNVNTVVYVIIAIGILGALAGYGYVRSRR